MSEFNIEDLDAVISEAKSSLVQMLALQLQKEIRVGNSVEQELCGMAVQLANAESKCRALAAENGRYSMSAGQADQRMSESRAVRSALGFQEDADDVSPSDLVEKIQSLITEQEMLCSAHPQPLGPIMDSAIDAFNSAEMPETGMLNAFFILRDSIIVKTPATDSFLAEVRASAIPEGYVLVPKEMHLSAEAMEGICFHCGDGGFAFGEFTDGLLFVGAIDDRDGQKIHGLHIATADYPEEGCATICEFLPSPIQGAAQ